ncbi:PRC-barrel domain containing protein (plasmid) [Mesorhizobium loti]|uniref:PRC-barrel domain containing protein n=1 Tax=Mesorhizobium jarvisii TaxID=1777867 RepID=A0A6M7TRN2_9HYPH|nr:MULTISPECIES: PRC-barrel domain-containing protein [Mesorhizobium]ANN62151.1 photosystem reaction center subunit H [Mesorhizobium loti NZP2037]OBQ70204.1 photosystem reaction center subunit H [Mesorhizobium loti]QKC67525.1 PRC-barrel domain containing protein [Mesorhizobium jarvisii]QKD13439.1 PRC-barrel domain containing protein [Mesorhizobium loti]RJT29548.1 PRC-barrel domain containing protein [Mesorhizobium jarvisii]
MLDTRSQSKKPPVGNNMKFVKVAAPLALFCALGVSPAFAVCNISDAKLEEAVLKSPELRKPENRYLVHDLRTLRDAAFVLWTYGLHDDCERVLANIRQLIAAPSMAKLAGNDEDLADEQLAAGEPKQHEGGGIQGNRDAPDARPLINLDDLGPGLRVDEIVGSEVRSSDDKIVGEVRNVVIGTKDRWDYAVVASGGFFIAGKDSIVVPLRYLQVNEERTSFYLRISSADVKAVPLMPDQKYLWLADEAWRAKNDAIFQKLIPDPVRSGTPSVPQANTDSK